MAPAGAALPRGRYFDQFTTYLALLGYGSAAFLSAGAPSPGIRPRFKRLLLSDQELRQRRPGAHRAVIAALLSLPDPFLQPYTRADAAPADGDYEAEAKLLSDDISFFKPRLAHFTKRGCSDALATLAMFDEWQRVLSDD